ncbi:MAG: error-prone DNA polymerase [Gammaproteobacteria bacterium]|nr:error-prone DNA polymerase [Gammaproteobacteria bacterium]
MSESSSTASPAYAELHCLSNFSFLRGASHPEELVRRAQALGYRAVALTDECSMAGVVRAHAAAEECGMHLIIGSELRLVDGTHLVLLAPEYPAYRALCTLITRARRRAEKGHYIATAEDVAALAEGCLLLWLPDPQAINETVAAWLQRAFAGRAWIAVELLRSGLDQTALAQLAACGQRYGLPLVAAGNVHMHQRDRKVLADVLTAIALKTTVAEAGFALCANAERHLRRRAHLAKLYPAALLAETLVIAGRCRFNLRELRYRYPREIVPCEETPASYLRRLTEAGIGRRWPQGISTALRNQIERELELIAELQYESYFLTVYDIVRYARSRHILCQGRGSAANSAVCFCLGITEVDPARIEVLFERFISRERNEPPDIDIDFEHERREEVIQYIYRKYGRERAALAATVITYKARSAVRDVGKALGLSLEQVDRLARDIYWWDDEAAMAERLRLAGLDPNQPVSLRLLSLVRTLIGFPRHLSQHVGGFVIADEPLASLVPVENAAMADRTVLQWDKDDLETLGLLKVDCLCLGMLTAIKRTFELVAGSDGEQLTMATVPAEDPVTYAMIQRADTVGVFQIESRAQMAMLPRLRPRCFYDLVIEVALIRPGPIQGEMVHPYLRRRNGEEAVEYPSEAVREVLQRTLGVPLFQEQVMRLAVVAAGFTPGEADQLRRAMATWKRNGGIEKFRARLFDGMRARGYSTEFATRIFNQIQGFGEYGFPESHSASFALLAYVSAWLKCHKPAAFTAALLNSQPMGFYAPSQLVQDARRHDVVVLAPDVNASDWDCTLEGRPASVRLGLRMIRGLAEASARRLVESRASGGGFATAQALHDRARLNQAEVRALARAGALNGLSGHRHRAGWDALGVSPALPVLPAAQIREGEPMLRRPREGEDIVADYSWLGLPLGRHPLSLLRPRLNRRRMLSATDITETGHGTAVLTCGLVISRQRPGTATGVVFVTLEDETGLINLIVWSSLVERQRRELLHSRLLAVSGEVQREGDVVHVIAHQLHDYSVLLGKLATSSRNFH